MTPINTCVAQSVAAIMDLGPDRTTAYELVTSLTEHHQLTHPLVCLLSLRQLPGSSAALTPIVPGHTTPAFKLNALYGIHSLSDKRHFW